jgi:cytochrome oxidase Cu insertion factor (SCO1/SenC/PrrC family)
MKYGVVLLAGALLLVGVAVAATALLLRSGDKNYGPTRAMVAQGETAPTFRLEGADGKFYSLDEYRGKKNVLLYFSMGYG